MAKKAQTQPEATDKKPKNVFDAQRARAETLGGFLRLTDHAMKGKGGIKSVFLSCSQYYCDEAADAVHDSLTTSTELVPDADDGGDPISYESRNKHMRWDDNGTAVYSFSPFCEEEGDVEGGVSSPLLLAQSAGDSSGSIRATWLGDLHRPWLDFHGAIKDREDEDSMFDEDEDGNGLAFAKDPPPATLDSAQERELYAQVLATPSDLGVREVLRDVWNERNDPRGELAAITSSKRKSPEMLRRAAALILEHGRSWLGPLGAVIPLSGALFDRGPFVRAATVYAANAKAFAKVANAPEWATVEELTFAHQSARTVTPAMKNLRVVGPLKEKDMEPLLAKGAAKTWRIEELDYEGLQLGPLLNLALPLRCLKVNAWFKGATDFKALAKEAPFWSKLERLELWLPPSPNDDAGEVEKTFKNAAAFIAPTCQLAVGASSNGRRSGWMLTGNAKQRRLELHLPDGRFGQGAAWAKAFGVKRVGWEPSATANDWLHFALGVSDETGKTKRKTRAT